MRERNRAETRHQEKRKKDAVKSYGYHTKWPATGCNYVSGDAEIGRRAATPCNCSCYMCGNSRKYDNDETVQEKSHKQLDLFD